MCLFDCLFVFVCLFACLFVCVFVRGLSVCLEATRCLLELALFPHKVNWNRLGTIVGLPGPSLSVIENSTRTDRFLKTYFEPEMVSK